MQKSLLSRILLAQLLVIIFFSSLSIGQIPVWRRMFYSQGEAVGINPKNPNTIYAQGFSGNLSVSHNKGASWDENLANIVYQTREIIVHPRDTLVIFVVNFSEGLWRSTNGGSSFTKVLDNFGIDGESVLLDPSHPDTMYAGNFSDAAVFRSTDRGATWALRGHAGQTGNLCALVARPDSFGVLYAGTGAGTISKSTNGGQTWHQVKTGGSSEIPKIVLNPINPMIAYGTGYEGIPSATGVWKTTDGGEHWALTALQNISVWGIDIDPLHPDTVYAGSFDEYNATVFRTTNGGTSWQALDQGFLPYNAVWNLKVDPSDPSNVYVGATYGAFGFDGVYKLATANAGIKGYIIDSYTGQPITSGSAYIQPLGEFVNLASSFGSYSFYRFDPDNTSNQTVFFSSNVALFHQENVALVNGNVLNQNISVDPGSLSGQVFNDLNGNGVKDGGEAVLPNRVMKMTGQITATVTTDINGNYTFPDLFPGNYTITEQPYYGWRTTAPDPANFNQAVSMGSKDFSGLDFGNIINHHVVNVAGGAQIPDPQNISLQVTFDSVMNPSTFNDSVTFIVRGTQTGIHRGSFGFSGGNTVATFTSTDEFQYGEEYTVEMSSALHVASGLPITPFVHHFQVPAPSSGGGFIPKTDLTTGNAPWSVAIADVNGDGHNDIITANTNGNSISVLRNNGNGTFAAKVDYSTGFSPRSVAVGDVDNDGDLDLVAANNGFSTITLLKNDGTGVFSSRTDYSAGGNPSCVALADVYGTGSLDIVTTLTNGDAIAVLKNDGSGVFGAGSPYSAGLAPWWLTVHDLNGDGGLDLAAAISTTDGTVALLLNIGDGVLQKLTSYTAGNLPRTVAVADLDKDGRPDIMVASSVEDHVLVYHQEVNGTFTLQSTLTTPRVPWSIATGDIDGDGWLDICVANANGGNFSYFRSINGIGFDARKDFKTGNSPRSIAIADIDGDGDQDAVVANSGSNSISIFRNVYTIASPGGWNLLSVPAQLVDYAKSTVYPASSSSAFAFTGTYVVADTLENGTGYWVKFDSVVDVGYNGSLLTSGTINVIPGWNMIGSIGVPVHVSSIISTPPGNITSEYFGYDGSYVVEDSIRPGFGYWVRATSNGSLDLSMSARQSAKSSARTLGESCNSLECVDSKGFHQTLFFTSRPEPASVLRRYEMPPLPAEQSFDVRFASQRLIEAVPDDVSHAFPVLTQGAQFPLTVRWSIHSGESRRWALVAGEKRKVMEGTGSLIVAASDAMKGGIRLDVLASDEGQIPSSYALNQNYPNPFNPSTRIDYGLPVSSHVHLIVTNILGDVVDELVNTEQDAGYHRIEWAPRIASGIYFCTLTATSSQDPTRSFVQTRKLILMK